MNIYTVTLNGIVDIIETYESLIWNIQFYEQSEFQLVVPGTDKNLNILQSDVMLVRECDIVDDKYQNVMIIENRQIDFDAEKGWTLTLTGHGLKSILGRRIVWEQFSAIGWITDIINAVVKQNAVSPTDSDRAIPNLRLYSESGEYEYSLKEIQLFSENLGEWLEKIGKEYNIGWDIYIEEGYFVFRLYRGTNRSNYVVFSPEYDTLAKTTYTFGKGDYKNAALVGGENFGDSQRTARIGDSTGLNRYETYIDGQSVSSNGEIIDVDTYIGMLERYGETELTKTSTTYSVDGTIIPNVLYTPGVDYNLGDIVKIENKGFSQTNQITEIIYSEDGSGSQVTPTFTEWHWRAY